MAMLVQCPNPACRASCSVAEPAGDRPVRCPKCLKPFVVKPTFDAQKGDTKKHPPSSNVNPFPVLPAVFGRYWILRLLGRGGMGAVYLAQDSQLGRQVALKVPFFDASESPQRAERFVREARSAAVLQHPNICTVFDAGQIDGRPFITMAYIAGTSLEDEIDPEAPMPQARAAEIVRKIALALEHAHRAGIVHRDLKPANVMMAAGGEPVVMDFGLAKRVADVDPNEAKLTRDGGLLGTVSYMAPEQVKGENSAVGPATDVYALGVMLFEMLTGRTPFTGGMTVVIGQILTAPSPPVKEFRPDVHPRLDAVCRKAMAKSPTDRFASMAEFADALGKCLKAPSSPALPRPAPPASIVKAAPPAANPSPFDDLGAAPPPKAVSKTARRGQVTVDRPRPKAAARPASPHLRTATLLRKKWPILAGGAAGLLLAALVILWAAGVFKVKTPDGILVVRVNEPNAEVFVDGDRMTVSWNDGGTKAEIHVKPGTRKVEVRKDGFGVDGTELTFKDGGREVFTARLLPEPRVANADTPSEKSPPAPDPRPVDAPPPTTPRSDYDDLAKGRWVPILTGPGEKVVSRGAAFKDGVLEVRDGKAVDRAVQAKDLIVRAKVKKVSGRDIALVARQNTSDPIDGSRYIAWFIGNDRFGLGKVDGKGYSNLLHERAVPEQARVKDGEFFELALAVVGDTLTVYINGKRIMEARDTTALPDPGAVGVATDWCLGQFKDIEVQILDKPPADAAAPPAPAPIVTNPVPPPAKEPAIIRVAVPDDAALADADKKIKEVYKDEYAKNKPEDVKALAAKLFQDGLATKDDPATQFALLRESRDLSARAGDTGQALRAADELAARFAVDAREMRTQALEQAGRATLKPQARANVAALALAYAEDAEDADDYATAERLGKAAQEAGQSITNKSLEAVVRRRAGEIQTLAAAYAPLQGTAKTLAMKADDPEANLALGKFFCLDKGDWDRGLPMLALGSDAKLKELAAKDAASPADAATQWELATGYAALAAEESGTRKFHLLRRARSWYAQAEAGLTGLPRAQASKNVADIDRTAPAGPPEILFAAYGHNDVWIDLTARVRVLLMQAKDQKLAVKVDAGELGFVDPAPTMTMTKSLVVVYRYDERVRLSITGDGSTADVPAAWYADAAKPAVGQALTILYARYGVDDDWPDATAKAQELVKGATLTVRPEDLGVGVPAPGKRKALVVVTHKGGRVRLSITGDSQAAVITGDASRYATGPLAEPADTPEWTPLFNGKDLTGWKTHPSQPGNWRVEKGVLIGSGPATSHLYSERSDYKDFHLRVEARINDGGNSGVHFRTGFGPGFPANNPRFPLGYEAQIYNSKPGDSGQTGSLFAGAGTLIVDIRESPAPSGEWFTQEVIAEGNHIVIKVNGKTIVDYTDDKRRSISGHITLEQHDPQTVVEFRKIDIKELK